MATIDDKLKGLLGERYISGNPEEVSKFFREKVSSTGLAVACAKTHEEVQEIAKNANETGTPIFTNYAKYLPQEVSDSKGVIIDFREMKEIERLDKKNLMAHIQCGLSFDEFQKELKKDDLKIQTPVAVTNDSAARGFVNRIITKSAAKYNELQVSNVYAVLADGRLHKSGSHSLNEMCADITDGAAFLSQWYNGASDIYGIISRASALIYPIWEKRNVIVYDFDSFEGMMQAMRDIPRREIGIEYVGMDEAYCKSLTGKSGSKFTLVIGFDGIPKYLDWQEKMVREFAAELGGKENKSLSEVFLDIIDDTWYAQGAYKTDFVTLFSRTKEFDEIVSGEAGKAGVDMGRIFVAMDRGRSVTCIYEFFNDDSKVGKMVDDLNIKLLDKGAVFDTPEGDFSKMVFDKISGYSTHLRKIKDFVDPKGILNPGILKF
ncbi:MAG: FAD-binding oxidoreductase [bacterium]|nr:FAD-binding oxidoreductase [bacterium]